MHWPAGRIAAGTAEDSLEVGDRARDHVDIEGDHVSRLDGLVVRVHGQVPAHAGIITCTFDPDSAALAARIDAAIAACGPLAGQLVRVIKPPRPPAPPTSAP